MGKVERDYKSFSSVAKPRFREMARELGYEQQTGTLYTRARDKWYEVFALQASSYGNPFFYFNYGVMLPDKMPASREALMTMGMIKYRRLKYKGEGAFPCATKAEIEESARYALEQYRNIACPWFEQLTMDEVRNGKL